MKNQTVRLADERDAAQLAEWAYSNPDIPGEDIDAVAKSTPLVLVVEQDGRPEIYLPLIPAMTLGFLAFRPGQDLRTKASCLKTLKEGLSQLQDALKISDAYVHTKAEYPMGKWALKNGFVKKAKDCFSLERK